MSRVDLHVHTRHSEWRHMRFVHPRDSYVEPVDAYRAARRAGMDFVAITDHDAVEGALGLMHHPEVEPARIIVGEEVECTFPETGQWVHVNVLGLTEADHLELRWRRDDVRAVVEYCRGRGLLHVLNHPFQSYFGQKPLQAYIEDILALFTHVEGFNGGVTLLQNRAVGALCREAGARGHRLTQVGGSDAHLAGRVGAAWTEADGDTAAAFLEEVKAGRCHPRGSIGGTWGLFMDVQAIIATYYGRLYTGRGDDGTAWDAASDLLGATLCLPAAFGPFPLAVVAANQFRQKWISRAVLTRLPGLNWNSIQAAAL